MHAIAESVANQIGYSPENHQKLAQMVKRIGGSIVKKDFWSSKDSGSILIDGEGQFTIFIPSDGTEQRDRFTIAHELGHYVLHYLWRKHNGDDPGPTCASRYGSDREEWEANWFAAAFLMPERPFRDAWCAAQGDKAFVVARKFGVSKRAAEIRAQALGEVA